MTDMTDLQAEADRIKRYYSGIGGSRAPAGIPASEQNFEKAMSMYDIIINDTSHPLYRVLLEGANKYWTSKGFASERGGPDGRGFFDKKGAQAYIREKFGPNRWTEGSSYRPSTQPKPSSGGSTGGSGSGSGPFPGGSPTGPGQTPSNQPPYNYHQKPNSSAPPRGPVNYGPAPFKPYPGGDPYGGAGYSGYGHEGYTGYHRPIFGGDSQWTKMYNDWLASGIDISQYAPEMGDSGAPPPPPPPPPDDGGGQVPPPPPPDDGGGTPPPGGPGRDRRNRLHNYYDYYTQYLYGV